MHAQVVSGVGTRCPVVLCGWDRVRAETFQLLPKIAGAFLSIGVVKYSLGPEGQDKQWFPDSQIGWE